MTRVDKAPYMPLYGKDCFDDEAFKRLSLAAQGLYWRLAWWQWNEGSIPADLKTILDGIALSQVADARKAWPAVEPHFPLAQDDRRKNARVEEHRQAMVRRREGNAKGGRKSKVNGVSQLPSQLASQPPSRPCNCISNCNCTTGESEGDFAMTTFGDSDVH